MIFCVIFGWGIVVGLIWVGIRLDRDLVVAQERLADMERHHIRNNGVAYKSEA